MKAETEPCPCTYKTPCSYACTCANPIMSGGCKKCNRYGKINKEALNKELCQLLGICWHVMSKYAVVDDEDGNGCVCGKCEKSFPLITFYYPNQGNPDFTSEAGRVQLLKIMEKREDFDRMVSICFAIPCGMIRHQDVCWFISRYLNDDEGGLALAVRDYLRKQEVIKSMPDISKPPCQECGAMTAEESETMCICAGDKDDCHGCHLWPA